MEAARRMGRMVRTPKKPPTKTDKAQSERFKELAKELEADGGLNLTEADKEFRDTLKRITRAKLDEQ